MTAEVIYVDFKTKKVVDRDEPEETFDPTVEFESFMEDFVYAVRSIGDDAFSKGTDYSKMALVLVDDETDEQWILFDTASVERKEIAKTLLKCHNSLIETAEE